MYTTGHVFINIKVTKRSPFFFLLPYSNCFTVESFCKN